MSQGKKLTPLFDLLNLHPGIARDSAGSNAAGVAVVRPVRQSPVSVEPIEHVRVGQNEVPAEIAREVVATDSAALQERTALMPAASTTKPRIRMQLVAAPKLDPATVVTVPRAKLPAWVWAAGAASLVAGLTLVWVIAFKSGEHKTVEERVKPLIAAPAPNIQHIKPLPEPGRIVQNEPAISPQIKPITPAPANPKPERPKAVAEPFARGIILAEGYVEQDPREAGLNYLSLAVLTREHAQSAVVFLAANKLDAFAVPLDRDGSRTNNAPPLPYRVYVGPGVSSQQYKANDQAMGQLSTEVERLGKVWTKDHKGVSDFRSPGWVKFKGES